MGSKMPSSHHLRSLSGWSRPLGQSSSILHSARLISPSFARQPVYVRESAAAAGWDYSNSVKGPFSARRVWKIFAIVPFLGADESASGELRHCDGSIKKIASHPKCHRRHDAHCEWISRLTDGLESIYVYSRMSFLIELRHRRRPQLFALGALSVKFENASLYWRGKVHLSRVTRWASGTWCGVSLFQGKVKDENAITRFHSMFC